MTHQEEFDELERTGNGYNLKSRAEKIRHDFKYKTWSEPDAMGYKYIKSNGEEFMTMTTIHNEPDTYPPTKRPEITTKGKYYDMWMMDGKTDKDYGDWLRDRPNYRPQTFDETDDEYFAMMNPKMADMDTRKMEEIIDMEYDSGGNKHLILNEKGRYEYISMMNPKNERSKTQSFDSIIMECQDMLSIEDKVQEKYEDWLNGGQTLKIKPPDNKKKIIASLLFSLISYLGINSGVNSEALIVVLLFAFLCSVITLLGLTIEVVLGRIKIKENIVKPSESSKFQFLKESYSGTISNLNERLELVQNRISEQIRTHQKDREQIQEYSDLLGDTVPIIIKIDSAICDLQLSSENLSEKKAEINKSLNEYIGESGVIAQKEKEIERLKVAQKLSDRMKTNFHTTMEITKSVDVLTDVIMPGLKQLMSLKIPELIEKVNFDCDKERVFLEINR